MTEHSEPIVPETTRRQMLAGAGALVFSFLVMPPARAVTSGRARSHPFQPNAFLKIGADSSVTVIVKHVEFGQGAATGLATLIAEELDADWSQLRIEFAHNDDGLYKNLRMGTMAVGGSTSMANSWTQMRTAGATARAVLVAAAAKRWRVPEQSISVSKGRIASGCKSTSFGELVADAAKLPVPTDVPLKAPNRFTLIGTRLPKLDSAAKSDGTAMFTVDVKLPGMVYALVAHPPKFGAVPAGFDGSAAMAIPGVRKVAAVKSGVAVFADSFPTALKARSALQIRWDDSKAETRSTTELFAEAARLADEPGFTVVENGAYPAALPEGAREIEAIYYLPHLAHAPMETLDAVMRARDGKLDVWLGSQFQVKETAAIAGELGIAEKDALLHQCYAGGSFGRRATPGNEFDIEAGQVCRAWGGPEPVKFLWTREDDIRGGFYRPVMVHKLRAAIAADGQIIGWDHRAAGQSIVIGTPLGGGAVKRGFDKMMIEGADEPGYRLNGHRLSIGVLESPIPVNWWRSVGHSHTAYVVEAFLDRLFAASGVDPVAGRLALLEDQRALAVVHRVAEMADWQRPRTAERTLGVAYAKSFGSYVAQIVEVSRGSDGLPRVHKVWAAVDCGIAINPDIIRAQIEGGIGFALGHALYGEITLGQGGEVEQSNFHDYRSLRIGEMPEVDVAIIPSDADPTGIGEPGVPPLAPAVANAWRKLTGEVVERLPFTRSIRSASQA